MIFFNRKKCRQEPALSVKDAFSLIREDEEYARELNFNFEKLHCNGCPNSCSISTVKCTRGRKMKAVFEKLLNQGP